MRRLSGSDIVLKVLGLLLIVAAVLKGHELLTTPVAGIDKRASSFSLGRKSAGFRDNSWKNCTRYGRSGKITVFCINIFIILFAIVERR